MQRRKDEGQYWVAFTYLSGYVYLLEMNGKPLDRNYKDKDYSWYYLLQYNKVEKVVFCSSWYQKVVNWGSDLSFSQVAWNCLIVSTLLNSISLHFELKNGQMTHFDQRNVIGNDVYCFQKKTQEPVY